MKRFLFVLLCLLASLSSAFAAEDFPSKPVQIIVPWSAGGPVDLTARALAQVLQISLKQPFVVVDRPGGAANIGAASVARADPDGYTLLLTADTALTANAALFGAKMGFDPERDLRPIVTVLSYGQMLVVHPSLPVKTLRDFITYAKQNPVTFAMSGAGSPSHLVTEQFNGLTGIRSTLVPYKGTSQAVNDLLGGQVQSGFIITPGVIQHVRTGRLVPLAVSSRVRSSLVPDVPTVAEAGLPDATMEFTFVLLAPAATPDAIVKKLNTEVRVALQTDTVREFMRRVDMNAIGDSPEEAKNRLEATAAQLGKLVRDANIKVE